MRAVRRFCSGATLCRVAVAAVASASSRVASVQTGQDGLVHFDVEVSADGAMLIVALARFTGGQAPASADVVLYERDGSGVHSSAANDAIFANVNTPALAYAAGLTADGLERGVTRANPARGHVPTLYIARRASATLPCEPPYHIRAATGFVEAGTFSPDGRSLYYHVLIGRRFSIARITR